METFKHKNLIVTKETWEDIYLEIYGKSEGSQQMRSWRIFGKPFVRSGKTPPLSLD